MTDEPTMVLCFPGVVAVARPQGRPVQLAIYECLGAIYTGRGPMAYVDMPAHKARALGEVLIEAAQMQESDGDGDEPRPPRGVVRYKAMPRDHAAEWDYGAHRWRGPSPAFSVEVPLDSDEDRRLRLAYERGTLTTVGGREVWVMTAEVSP